jgi:hypothetical protein
VLTNIFNFALSTDLNSRQLFVFEVKILFGVQSGTNECYLTTKKRPVVLQNSNTQDTDE